MEKIVICDICNTLYKVNTLNEFFNYFFKNYKVTKLRNNIFYKIICKIFWKLKIDLNKILCIRLLKDISKNEIDIMAEKFFKEYLIKQENKKVFSILKDYKKKGYLIILVSGTISPIAKIICKNEKFYDYIAVDLKIKNDKYTGKIKEDTLFKKHLLIEKYKDCQIAVITDNKTDIDLLKIANEKIIVTNKNNIYFWKKKFNNFKVIYND